MSAKTNNADVISFDTFVDGILSIPVVNLIAVVIGYLGLFLVWTVGGLFLMLFLMMRHVWRILTSGVINFDIAGETVVITGGSSGIGLALAKALSFRYPNATICVLDVKPISDPLLVAPNVRYYECDVSDRDSVARVAEKILQEAGPPALLVNNAGIVQTGRVWELDPAKTEKVFAVNVLAHFCTVREFLPAMMKRDKGHIVTVASALGTTGVAQISDYCASKSAAVGFTESLRQELSGTNIKTHLVMPGLVTTDMFAAVHPMTLPFLTPPLSADKLVRSIITNIERGEHSEVKLPFYTKWAFLFRLFPPDLADAMRNMFSANRMLDGVKL
ncbi:NAD(P)-binding protein [Gonapodya prolifera JEL478]|uniref:NAD(P)-binding protein n=1 Tax=Gonapodya prolifera (strain JEL478) TaxID=1344416 RepID=A0A139AYP2_GONPJ|nr:NAD(P)-binding protein [Gonapodya prolifera JEL478]|eukprot:KXS21861.1 NAD(P)-binding protein [Gonapodya prolifera JEL478]